MTNSLTFTAGGSASKPAEANPKRLRVLFITRKWPPAIGGMETYSHELTRELQSLTDLEIRALPGRADGSPPSLWRLLVFFLSTLVFLLRCGTKFDVVHLGDFVLFPLAWAHSLVAPGARRIMTAHGLDLIYGNRTGLLPAIYRRYVGWASRRSDVLDGILANSSNTARLAAEAGFTNSVVVPLGVRITSPNSQPSAPVDLSDRYILFIGRLVPRKGASWFARNVLPRLPSDISLKVVGSTWDAREAETLRAQPRVQLLGFVDGLALEEPARQGCRYRHAEHPNSWALGR